MSVAAQPIPVQAGDPARPKDFQSKPFGPPGPNRPGVISSCQRSNQWFGLLTKSMSDTLIDQRMAGGE